jgi:hypothetical protein
MSGICIIQSTDDMIALFDCVCIDCLELIGLCVDSVLYGNESYFRWS